MSDTDASPAVSRQPALDLALLGVAVVAISTSAPLIRAAAAPALAIAFWRNAIAVGALIPVVAIANSDELGALTERERRQSVTAGIYLGAHFATWVPSLSFTTVASSVALVATQPVWAALLARRRGEHVSGRTWAGIVVALAGVLLLTGVDLALSARALFGDALALAGGVLAALYVTVGADVRRTVSTNVYTLVCYSVAAVGLLVVCLVSGQDLVGYSTATWLYLLAMAAGPQLLGHSVVNRVLRTTSATVVSVAILFEIVGSTFLAWVFFDEAPPAAAYPAAVLIGAGVVLVVGGGRTRRPPVTSAPLAAD
jgi:drug/metabolite transporter (DMT)-like permease